MSTARNVLRTTLEAAMELQIKPESTYETLFPVLQRLITAHEKWLLDINKSEYYEAVDEFLVVALMLSKSHLRPFAQTLTAVVDGTEDIFAVQEEA